jgi:hypothetical protein
VRLSEASLPLGAWVFGGDFSYRRFPRPRTSLPAPSSRFVFGLTTLSCSGSTQSSGRFSISFLLAFSAFLAAFLAALSAFFADLSFFSLPCFLSCFFDLRSSLSESELSGDAARFSTTPQLAMTTSSTGLLRAPVST